MAVPERWEGVTVEEMIEHFTEKEAEVERLREALTQTKALADAAWSPEGEHLRLHAIRTVATDALDA